MSSSWFDRFKNFTGDFGAFVKMSAEATASVLPGTPVPSESLIRHYQQTGAVGRGIRAGRASQYGFRELLEVVATKSLVNAGWTVSNIASLIGGMDVPRLLDLIENVCEKGVVPSSTATDVKSAHAMSLVQEMLNASHRPRPMPSMTAYASSTARSKNVPYASSVASAVGTHARLDAGWLQAYADVDRLRSLDQSELDRTLESLRLMIINIGEKTP